MKLVFIITVTAFFVSCNGSYEAMRNSYLMTCGECKEMHHEEIKYGSWVDIGYHTLLAIDDKVLPINQASSPSGIRRAWPNVRYDSNDIQRVHRSIVIIDKRRSHLLQKYDDNLHADSTVLTDNVNSKFVEYNNKHVPAGNVKYKTYYQKVHFCRCIQCRTKNETSAPSQRTKKWSKKIFAFVGSLFYCGVSTD